jgi:hypothetical protein
VRADAGPFLFHIGTTHSWPRTCEGPSPTFALSYPPRRRGHIG